MTVLLDGAMGTELARRGFELRAPLFGARAIRDAPQLVTEIHAAYARAGAQVLVTGSFGLGPDEATLASEAVALVRAAAPRRDIAGSIGPPDPRRPIEHQRTHLLRIAEALAEGGASILFAETHTTLTGARLAVETLRPLGLPVWVALSCDGHGRTLTGDPLDVALHSDAVFVGCTEYPGLEPALEQLVVHNPVVGVRPSLALTTAAGFEPAGASPWDVIEAVVRCAERFELAYAGGCCGTTPAFVASLAEALR